MAELRKPKFLGDSALPGAKLRIEYARAYPGEVHSKEKRAEIIEKLAKLYGISLDDTVADPTE